MHFLPLLFAAFVLLGVTATAHASIQTLILAASAGVKSYSYDAVGNLITKSDTGTYTYGQNGAGPHAVTSINGTLNGVTNPTFIYDANGNLIGGAGRSIDYTSYNKPSQIISNGQTVNFSYDPNHGRVIQTTEDTTTVYVGSSYEQISNTTTGMITHKHYISAGGGTVAVYTYESDLTSNTRYLHADQLGSIDTITDEGGSVVERLSYDPFGQRRQSNWQDATGPITSLTPYGYTGQEHIEEVGLIHMNGRVYDPQLGRFVSPDPFVQFPHSTQGMNRYTYVNNNPMILTDPSGYNYFKRVVKAYNKWTPQGRSLAYAIRKNPEVAVPLGTIAAGIACNGAGAACAGAFSAYATTTLGGSNQQALRSGAITYATARAYSEVGGQELHGVKNTVANGMVGGASSRASGGSFRSGFMSGAFTSAATAHMNFSSNYSYTAAGAAIGGTASVLGGGKFGDGAVTGAFSSWFGNHMLENNLVGMYEGSGISVSVDGNNVALGLKVKFTGEPVSEIMEKFAIDVIEGEWSGRFGRYNTTMTVTVAEDAAISISVYHAGEGYNGGASWNAGRSTISVASKSFRDLPHEVGHIFLGPTDYYNRQTRLTYAGHEADIMGGFDSIPGRYNRYGLVNEHHIDKILGSFIKNK